MLLVRGSSLVVFPEEEEGVILCPEEDDSSQLKEVGQSWPWTMPCWWSISRSDEASTAKSRNFVMSKPWGQDEGLELCRVSVSESRSTTRSNSWLSCWW